MNGQGKPNYGIAITLLALLVISATAAAYFAYENGQTNQSKNTYVSELSSETSAYDKLAANYNTSLSLDNQTISLLASSIAQLNTSLPIYQQASGELSQLWAKYLALKPAASSLYAADILVDFGNGTSRWYNGTQAQPGWNLYTETVVLTSGNLAATWYPAYGEHLVTGIDGVSDTSSESWFLWTYNQTASWQIPPVGADDLPVYNDSVFAWTYCGMSPSYSPECTP